MTRNLSISCYFVHDGFFPKQYVVTNSLRLIEVEISACVDNCLWRCIMLRSVVVRLHVIIAPEAKGIVVSQSNPSSANNNIDKIQIKHMKQQEM